MLDSKILDRARRLIQTQFDQRRKIFPDDISRVLEEMVGKHSLHSGATLENIYTICAQEVAIRAKIVLESIKRAHKAIGLPLTETLAADIKKEGSYFIEKIIEEVGEKMSREMHFMEREAKHFNLSSAKHGAIQEMNIETDLYVDSLAKDSKNLESVNITETQNMIKLFISHSSKDQELAEKLTELVKNALRLSSSEIRCTTIDGYRLPGGAKTNEQLKRELRDSNAFIGLISAAATDSMYVLFELGARWGSDNHLLPLLAPGVSPDILKGPLSDLNALSCNNSSQLQQLVQDLANVLKIKPENPAAYQRYIDGILTISPSVGKIPSEDDQVEVPPACKLTDIQLRILKAVADMNRREATVAKITRVTGLSDMEAKYNLDELSQKHKLLNWIGNMNPDIPDRYVLTHEGRGFVLNLRDS